MKKNKMMRLASGLLVAVLITTSTISGTYAKYVTEDSATDSARVAKFGVMLAADGTLFDTKYAKDSLIVGGEDSISVKSETTENLVAPGTKNDEGISFSIKGNPEVDVRVTVAFTALGDADKDVFLTGTGLPNTTTYDTVDSFDITNYYPVQYTLWQKKDGVADYTAVTGAENVNLSALKAVMGTTLNQYYDANTELEDELGDFKITWKWDFGTEGGPITDYDKADTLLGNLADENYVWGVDTKPTEGYNLKTGINFTIRVEQVD